MKANRQFSVMLTALLWAISICASAQEQSRQFIPVLSYRTGPHGKTGAQMANGYIDYLKLVNARGGINGVRLEWEECETAFVTSRTIDCYEQLKARHGAPALLAPTPTGAAYVLSERAAADGFPLITAGYGRSEWADGATFKWNFALGGNHWVAASAIVQAIAAREGGSARLRGKKLALVFHDSPHGREPIPILRDLSERIGFELVLLRANIDEASQDVLWTGISGRRPDYVLLWGWPPMTSTALLAALRAGYPVDRIYGGQWSNSELDVGSATKALSGYNAVSLQQVPSATRGVTAAILAELYGTGRGTGPRQEVGQVSYTQGVVSAMLGIEGVRVAQHRYGYGRVMSGRQVRWGLENLSLGHARLQELGFEDVLLPIFTTCTDHMGSFRARLQTWTGTSWINRGEPVHADEALIRSLTRSRARLVADQTLLRRTAADCQP